MRAARLNESIFDELASASGEDLISVFIPTHKTGRDVAQDRIRLKNQLGAVEETLADLGWKPRERSERLATAHALLDDLDFWEHQEAGLAVYLDDDGAVVTIATTRPVEVGFSVMPVYQLRPLVADLIGVNLPVLALTKDEVALFAADEFGVDVIPADLPSYQDVNWFVDREKERQQHPDMVGTDRSRHGHEPSARRDEDLARFLREVDAALHDLGDSTALVVMGDDDIVSRFSQVSDRPTLSPPNSGIRPPFSAPEVAERVADIAAEFDAERIEKAKEAAMNQLGVGMATADIREAIPAAVGGRVDRLLINRSAASVWGRFDEMSSELEVHEEARAGDVDLLDRLVVWARDTGADIVSSEDMIDGKAFVATFRY